MTAKKGKAKAPTNGTVKHDTCGACSGARVVGDENCAVCDGTGYVEMLAPTGEPPLAAQRATEAADAAALADEDEVRRIVPVKETVNVRLTDDERNESAREAAALHAELAKQEDEFSQLKKGWQEDLKELKGRMASATREANSGEAIRKVDALRVFDLEGKRTWIKYRGERYSERGMSHDELDAFASRNLFGDPPIIPGVSPIPGLTPSNGDGSAPKPKRKASAPVVTVTSAFDHEAAERASGAKLGGSSSADIADVMRDEKSVRGKRDHSSL